MRISDLAILLQRKASLSDPQLVVRNPAAKDSKMLSSYLTHVEVLSYFYFRPGKGLEACFVTTLKYLGAYPGDTLFPFRECISRADVASNR